MKSFLTVFVILITVFMSKAQESDLPYYEIPDAPKEYTPETAVSRMIDGLGFRYYWATDNLREEDLSYKPSEDARTSRQTIDHIFGLTIMFLSSLQGEVAVNQDISELDFDEVRTRTLLNIKEASDLLKNGAKLDDSTIKFSNGTQMDFWYNINGPIADALWHVGQVVTFRRSSGNPYNSNASVFTGKVKD